MQEKKIMIVCAGEKVDDPTQRIAYYYAGLLKYQKLEPKIFFTSQLLNMHTLDSLEKNLYMQDIYNTCKMYNRYVFMVSETNGLLPNTLREFIKICFPTALLLNRYCILVRIISQYQKIKEKDRGNYTLGELVKFCGTRLHPLHLKITYSENEPMKNILSNEVYLEILKNQIDFLKNI